MYPIVVFKLGCFSACLPEGNAPVLKLGNFGSCAKCMGAVTNAVIFLMIALLNVMWREDLSFVFLLDNGKEKETYYCFKPTAHGFSIWIRQICMVFFLNQGGINLDRFMEWSKNKYSFSSQKLRQAFPTLSYHSAFDLVSDKHTIPLFCTN